MSIVTDLFDGITRLFKGRAASETEIVQRVYQKAIVDLEAELEKKIKIIEGYRLKHNGSGPEFSEWIEREREYHKQLVDLLQRNRDLREENMFLRRLAKWDGETGK